MMIRKYLILAALAVLAAVSCGKTDPEKDKPAITVEGIWELTSITKSASIDGVSIDVYLDFSAGSFNLYQKIGEGRYTKFTGTYKQGDDQTLSGSYADGEVWGPWGFVVEDTSLTLTKGSETDTYKKIDAIPEAVLSNVYPN